MKKTIMLGISCFIYIASVFSESIPGLRSIGSIPVAAASIDSMVVIQNKSGVFFSLVAGKDGQLSIYKHDSNGASQIINASALDGHIISARSLKAFRNFGPAWMAFCIAADPAGVESIRSFEFNDYGEIVCSPNGYDNNMSLGSKIYDYEIKKDYFANYYTIYRKERGIGIGFTRTYPSASRAYVGTQSIDSRDDHPIAMRCETINGELEVIADYATLRTGIYHTTLLRLGEGKVISRTDLGESSEKLATYHARNLNGGRTFSSVLRETTARLLYFENGRMTSSYQILGNGDALGQLWTVDPGNGVSIVQTKTQSSTGLYYSSAFKGMWRSIVSLDFPADLRIMPQPSPTSNECKVIVLSSASGRFGNALSISIDTSSGQCTSKKEIADGKAVCSGIACDDARVLIDDAQYRILLLADSTDGARLSILSMGEDGLSLQRSYSKNDRSQDESSALEEGRVLTCADCTLITSKDRYIVLGNDGTAIAERRGVVAGNGMDERVLIFDRQDSGFGIFVAR